MPETGPGAPEMSEEERNAKIDRKFALADLEHLTDHELDNREHPTETAPGVFVEEVTEQDRDDLLHERQRLEEVVNPSRVDPLTKLQNRKAYEEAVAHGREEDPGTATLVTDINNFKEINDTLGHAAGDEVLRKLAELVSAEAVVHDVSPRLVYRYGGDEIFLHAPAESAQTIVDALKEIVGEQYVYQVPHRRSDVSTGAWEWFLSKRPPEEMVDRLLARNPEWTRDDIAYSEHPVSLAIGSGANQHEADAAMYADKAQMKTEKSAESDGAA
jgi:diguanylate cyclase (GGDEF)-like protein